MKYIKCDRCGTLFSGAYYNQDRKFLIYINATQSAQHYHNHEVDLCPDCEDKLLNWVVSYNEKDN